jgi:hypothetical protein
MIREIKGEPMDEIYYSDRQLCPSCYEMKYGKFDGCILHTNPDKTKYYCESSSDLTPHEQMIENYTWETWIRIHRPEWINKKNLY